MMGETRRATSAPWYGRQLCTWLISAFLLLMSPSLKALNAASTSRDQAVQLLKANVIVELAVLLKQKDATDPKDPFIIAVIGESRFTDELKAAAKGRKVQGRPIRIEFIQNLPEGRGCDLLFICHSEWPRARSIVAWSRGKDILTVAEGDTLAAQGVMVNLLAKDETIKLGINQQSLDEEKINLGARLSGLSITLVHSKPKP